jgi:anaerobic dimethyl sulfoxide reductase subunit C (anchor subunit)
MEHIRPVKYRVWGWPAVANFVIGGMASGFYLLCFLDILLRGGIAFSDPEAIKFTLLSPLLIVLGALFMTFEAGRPLRGGYILGNLKSSWMSREVLSGTAFVLLASTNWLFPHPVLYVLSVGAVLIYLISQGYIVYRARAVTAWNVPLAPILFLTSGVVAGCGLLLIVIAMSGLIISIQIVVAGIVCLILNLFVYGFYALFPRRDHAFREATAILRNPVYLIVVLGVGHLVPGIFIILILSLTGLNETVSKHFQEVLFVLTGLSMVSGGAFLKILIILGGNSPRSIMMGQPQSRSVC